MRSLFQNNYYLSCSQFPSLRYLSSDKKDDPQKKEKSTNTPFTDTVKKWFPGMSDKAFEELKEMEKGKS